MENAMQLPQIVAIGIYHSAVAAKNVTVSKHRKTSMFELELPLEEGGVSYIDQASMPITSDLLICAKPGQVRHTKFPFKCYYIHMILNEGLLYETLMKTPDFFKTKKGEFHRDIFKKMVRYYNTFSAKDEIILQSLILELIYAIERETTLLSQRGNHKENNHPSIQEALTYIKSHLTEELSLSEVAKTVSLSPIHFHNKFKSAVGKTLRDYVEEQRIKKAILLLTDTSLSLTEIAYECGFSSQSYFSYVFKRRMKKTPRQYVRETYDRYEL